MRRALRGSVWLLRLVAVLCLFAAGYARTQADAQDSRRHDAERVETIARTNLTQRTTSLHQAKQNGAAALSSLDAARADLERGVVAREMAATQAEQARRAADTLQSELTNNGLKVIEQGVHLNELLLCLKAAERAYNALAVDDRATAGRELRSTDAECKSSSAYLVSRSATPPTATPPTAVVP